jgi:hypothetical protein
MFNDRSQNTETGVMQVRQVVAPMGAVTLTSLGCWRDVRWEGWSYLAKYLPNRNSQGDNIMKKSLIWITAGIATVGFAVPAFAAHGDSPSDISPSQVTVATTAATVTTNSVTPNTVEDNPARIGVDDNGVDVTTNSVDDNGVDVTTNSVDDSVTDNSVDDNGVDDATVNSVEDISGPCDEAEHAADPRCTGVVGSDTDDNSGHDANDDRRGSNSGSDDSGHHGGGDDD